MIRSVSLFLVFTLPAGAARASSWADGLFSGLDHDWGAVERGAQLSHQFTLTNTTGREVRIKSLNVSCHCTTAMTSSYRIGPGETAIIDARMDTSGFLGAKTVTIFVRFDRPNRGETSLRVTATTGGNVGAGANEIDFGLVPIGTRVEKRLNLDFAGSATWQINALDYNSAILNAAYKEVSRAAGKVRYELVLTLPATAPAGSFEEKIHLKTNDEHSPEILVLAKARIEAKLSIAPEFFKVDSNKPGATITRNVIVRSPTPFRILRANNTLGLFKVLSAPEDRTTQLVMLTYTVPANPAAAPDHIELVTNLPEERAIMLPLHAIEAK